MAAAWRPGPIRVSACAETETLDFPCGHIPAGDLASNGAAARAFSTTSSTGSGSAGCGLALSAGRRGPFYIYGWRSPRPPVPGPRRAGPGTESVLRRFVCVDHRGPQAKKFGRLPYSIGSRATKLVDDQSQDHGAGGLGAHRHDQSTRCQERDRYRRRAIRVIGLAERVHRGGRCASAPWLAVAAAVTVWRRTRRPTRRPVGGMRFESNSRGGTSSVPHFSVEQYDTAGTSVISPAGPSIT